MKGENEKEHYQLFLRKDDVTLNNPWKQTGLEISPITALGFCFIRTNQSLRKFVEHECEGDNVHVGHGQPGQAEKSNRTWTDSPCTEQTQENKQEFKLPLSHL